MSSKPTSPRHDTELDIESHRKITHIDDPFNCVTTLAYRVVHGVMTFIDANDPIMADLNDSQKARRRRARKRDAADG
jgi:hypothetical protein